MLTDNALKIYCAIKNGFIKSRIVFHKNFFTAEDLKTLPIAAKEDINNLKSNDICLTCIFDDNFPLPIKTLKNSDKPFFFAYRGNLELLKSTANNIAVIGTLDPTVSILSREKEIIMILAADNATIVSGLARGCDTAAHKTCIENGGKTVAILPSTFENIYPKENRKLADEIVKNGGLVISEYIVESDNRYERIKRFIERDTLQAIYSSSVVLIASYRYGEGDSGSRYAMNKANEYNIPRYVMYNDKTDKIEKVFGLNRDLINSGASILTNKNIGELIK